MSESSISKSQQQRGSLNSPTNQSRRSALKLLGATGSAAVFSRALSTFAGEGGKVSEEMVQQAEWIAGVRLSDEERQLMLEGINELRGSFDEIRAVEIDNGIPPALLFAPQVLSPASGGQYDSKVRVTESAAAERPADDENLAFLPVSELSALIRTRQISSTELTEFYLNRLERVGERLECVITLTRELALEQARRADQELAAGIYRGPLHGVPWGAKDLLAVPKYRTTWGAKPYEEQVIDLDASGTDDIDVRLTVTHGLLRLPGNPGITITGDWVGGDTTLILDGDKNLINAALDGETVLIPAGTYSRSFGVFEKSLTLRGDGRGMTILRPGIVALPHALGRIMPLPENPKHCIKTRFLGIKDDPGGFRMTGPT